MKVNDRAPVNPDNRTKIIFVLSSGFIILEAKWVIVQKRNNIVKALDKTLKKLIESHKDKNLVICLHHQPIKMGFVIWIYI